MLSQEQAILILGGAYALVELYDYAAPRIRILIGKIRKS